MSGNFGMGIGSPWTILFNNIRNLWIMTVPVTKPSALSPTVLSTAPSNYPSSFSVPVANVAIAKAATEEHNRIEQANAIQQAQYLNQHSLYGQTLQANNHATYQATYQATSSWQTLPAPPPTTGGSSYGGTPALAPPALAPPAYHNPQYYPHYAVVAPNGQYISLPYYTRVSTIVDWFFMFLTEMENNAVLLNIEYVAYGNPILSLLDRRKFDPKKVPLSPFVDFVLINRGGKVKEIIEYFEGMGFEFSSDTP